jgi:hypothetical protein
VAAEYPAVTCVTVYPGMAPSYMAAERGAMARFRRDTPGVGGDAGEGVDEWEVC